MRKLLPFAILFLLISASTVFAHGGHAWAVVSMSGDSYTVDYKDGGKYTWTITDATESSKGCLVSVRDQNGNADHIDGDVDDMAGMKKYFGVTKASELKWRRFSGDDLAIKINKIAAWSSLHNSEKDKRRERIAKGIALCKDFDVSDEERIPASEFVNGALNKDFVRYVAERVTVFTNGRFEMVAAKAEEFNFLPQAIYFDTFQLRETITTAISAQGPDGTISPTETAQEIRIFRFSISADCTNAVQFDPMRDTDSQMSQIHAP